MGQQVNATREETIHPAPSPAVLREQIEGLELRAHLEVLMCLSLVTLLSVNVGVMLEPLLRIFMHSARFYLFVAMAAPLWMGVAARLIRRPWACTIVAGGFTVWRLLWVWFLPLFPAEPKLGPVYFPVTHLIPPDFPLLLIVPAAVCDLVRRRLARHNNWLQGAVLGTIFLVVFLAVQWPFADFLMSPASRNAFFGTHYYPFFIPPTSDWARNVYSVVERSAPRFWWRMAMALALSMGTMRLGLAWGVWMTRVRR